jgi:hypothetical protein
MSLILRNPNLVDVALSAMNLIDDDRRQYEAFTGDAYDANEVPQSSAGQHPGLKWAICDESGLPLAVGWLFNDCASSVYRDVVPYPEMRSGRATTRFDRPNAAL